MALTSQVWVCPLYLNVRSKPNTRQFKSLKKRMLTESQTTITVLAVDDDSEVRATIGRALKTDGHCVLEAEDAQEALRLAQEYRPDLIILDIMLADMSGFDLCSHLRSMPFVNRTPILFLSVHQSAQYVARALDCGGDDYLRKPFAARELKARVRALLRRSASGHNDNLPVLRLHPESHSVFVNEQHIVLTPTEYVLLDHLCHHQTDHHTSNSLLETLWHYPPGDGDTALIRNHIRNLRRKIEEHPNRPAIIVSLHGRGYTIKAHIVSPD
jgi:two-component system OmpR family response regulator